MLVNKILVSLHVGCLFLYDHLEEIFKKTDHVNKTTTEMELAFLQSNNQG